MPDANKTPKTDSATLRRVLAAVRRYQGLLILSIVLATATVALTLYVPILIGEAIDRIVGPGKVDFAAILSRITLIAAVVGITALLQWLMNTINNRVTFQVIRDMRAQAFAKIQTLPLGYLDAHPVGDVVSRVIADVDQLADGLLMGFTQLFTGSVTILSTLVFLFALQWKIALVVLLVTPLSLFVARLIARKTHAMFRLQSETRGEQTALIDEMLTQQKVVQAFGQEQAVIDRFDEGNDRLTDASLKAIFFSSITFPTTRFINALVYAGVGLAGALTAVATGGAFSVGQLSVFLSYATQFAKPFNEISGVVTELQNALACAARVFALLDEPSQTPDAADAETLADVRGEVDAAHVRFSYTEARPLIRDFSLHAQPGQRIAIVGPTGCGKTTLINLLMRFYDVQGGEIRVDGHETRALTRHSLRSAFGMVLQDTWLMAGTIRENLKMGKPDATDDEMIAAARASHAHGFIRRLPDGYDTLIGEDGGSLSQGQKQLLCIARVMLCRPPMLILDEATSSIDTRTEAKIQDAFTRLMQGRTSFIVAHRLSTIRNADWILVMRDGDIVEQGTHDLLLAQNGFYAHLYRSQFAA